MADLYSEYIVGDPIIRRGVEELDVTNEQVIVVGQNGAHLAPWNKVYGWMPLH